MTRAPVAAALAASTLALAGCTGSRLSADGAAQQVQQYLSSGYSVQCAKMADAYWSFMCTVTPPRNSKDRSYREKVKVGATSIQDRIICGKQGSQLSANTLAQTKC